MLRKVDFSGRAGRLAVRLVLALAMVGAGLGPAHAVADPTDATEPAGATGATGEPRAGDGSEATAPVPQDPARRQSKISPLDRRVMLLTRELGLNAAQQAQMKKVLEGQREQVVRVWNDTSIPAARRVSATQAIGDRTADRIRALLTAEQRKKYIQPRQRQVAVGTAGGDAESWMNGGKRK